MIVKAHSFKNCNKIKEYILKDSMVLTLTSNEPFLQHSFYIRKSNIKNNCYVVKTYTRGNTDEEDSYRYVGLFYGDTLRLQGKQGICYELFSNLLRQLRTQEELDNNLKLYFARKCVHCGALLLKPESIINGCGKYCMDYNK